jgi:hypothetical protein
VQIDDFSLETPGGPYLTDHAGKLAVSTLSRRLSAINEAHQALGTTGGGGVTSAS